MPGDVPSSIRLAVIAGDGIGPEVTGVAIDTAREAAAGVGCRIETETLPWSADYYLQSGITVPPDGYDLLRGFDEIGRAHV